MRGACSTLHGRNGEKPTVFGQAELLCLAIFFNLHFCDNSGDSQFLDRIQPSWNGFLDTLLLRINKRNAKSRQKKAQWAFKDPKENFWCANLITALRCLYVSAAWNTTVRKNLARGSWTDHSLIGYTHLSTHTDVADLLWGGNIVS